MKSRTERSSPGRGTATRRMLGGHVGAGFRGLQVNLVARFRGIRPMQKLYCLVFDKSGDH
jgi:hypothetical protein